MTTLYTQTPLSHSIPLSQKTPCQIFLKHEHAQPSGSFKHRGISHHINEQHQRILQDPETAQKKAVVVAPSGGNAGCAASHTAKSLGLESIVVVPKLTNAHMRQKIAESGATVIVAGENFAQTDQYLKEVVIPSLGEESLAIYCHPSDDPEIWEGHSSLVDEICQELQTQNKLHRLKAIVCSVGGGGLYCGIVVGLKRNGLTDVAVLTTECDTCPAFQAAIDAGEPTTITGFKSVATSLAVPIVCEKAVQLYNEHKTKHVLVTDSQAAGASVKFAKDHNVIVEPACGAALAVAYDGILTANADFFGGLEEEDIVVIVACGGSATTESDLAKYKEVYGL